ncbi:MAG: hypothetical protein IPP73_07785 [Chitinophagaceae bacterium]|nr:hypothetical protein [Chitinophagaceae bacterium]
MKSPLIILLLLLSATGQAQVFGGTPPEQKWKQINTDTVRVIYPTGLDSQANRISSIVHYLAAVKPFSLGNELHKVNIVLQHQTVIPNGYVAMGPYRSEFFLTPVFNNFQEGSIGWADQLAVHEYRHVQQFNNFRQGISKTMKFLFGEDGYTLAVNAAIPEWFYEGDAVYQETAVTGQGRGRLPLFMNVFPALWQSGKKYTWMKLRNGSFKDFVPNHYYLGYLLVNYGREKYGPEFWTKVTKDASAFKGLLYPFQVAVKKYSGVEYKTFLQQAFDWYKSKTERTASTREDFLFPVNKKTVTSYQFPYRAGSDSIIYLKQRYDKRAAFYLHDKDGEHKIAVKDISIDDQYSYRNGKIVYASYTSDPRWRWRDYSVITVLDTKTGEQKQITARSKYFTPDISEDGQQVAAVYAGTDGKSAIRILNATTGEVLGAITDPGVSLFTDPKFADDHTLVTALRYPDGRMALALADIPTKTIKTITPVSFHVVGYPSVSNGYVFFTAGYSGNDELYAVRLSDQQVFNITQDKQGSYFVNASGNQLTWSAFTAEGYQLKKSVIDPAAWTAISRQQIENYTAKFPVSHASVYNNLLCEKLPVRQFASTRYKKSTRLLNFHSWRPYYSDPVFTFSVYGENVLNTMQTELYYSYNQNEKLSSVGFTTVFGGLFPYLQAGSELSFNRDAAVGNKTRTWNQLDSRIGFSIPISYAKGKTYRQFSAGSFYVLRNEFNKGYYGDSAGNTSFSYLQHFISGSRQIEMAAQHIYPRLGISYSLNHRHAITRFTGYQFIGSAAVFLPGIMPAHSIVLTGSFQQRDTLSQISFSDRFAYSRGYTGRYFSRMWRMSANYHFPLLYPDWGFANLLYIQRIRLNAFYDFTKVYSKDKLTTRDQRSAGIEFYADTKWWNQYPLTFGFRISRLLDTDQFDGFKGTIFEFILPVSIIPR